MFNNLLKKSPVVSQVYKTYLVKKVYLVSGGIGKMPTAPRVPRRSPIQVLTGLNVASLQGSDENWCFQRDMAVGERKEDFTNTRDKTHTIFLLTF